MTNNSNTNRLWIGAKERPRYIDREFEYAPERMSAHYVKVIIEHVALRLLDDVGEDFAHVPEQGFAFWIEKRGDRGVFRWEPADSAEALERKRSSVILPANSLKVLACLDEPLEAVMGRLLNVVPVLLHRMGL